MPTLNAFDNGDTRATVLVVEQPTVFYESGPGFINQAHNAGTLRAEGENRPSRPTHTIASGSTVRRLTPTECERLQGFPDNWTDGQADSNRYKQMGNAVAVPVVDWIVKRLISTAE